MANDKSNTNELVSDDGTISELETLTVKRLRDGRGDALLESSAITQSYEPDDDENVETTINELMSDLEARSETINRLQFDIQQFRSRWNGLEAEIKARQEITENLNRQVADIETQLARKDKLIRKRDQAIKALKAEIRQRHERHDEAQERVAELEADIALLHRELDANRSDATQHDRELIERQEGQIASKNTEIQDLRAQLERTERYADSLRRQSREQAETAERSIAHSERLESRHTEAVQRISQLEAEVAAAHDERTRSEEQISRLHSEHAEEIRTIRFELGEAQETVAQQELIAEQLASDLVDTRGYRAELERMLTRTEASSQDKIEALEKLNAKLEAELDDYRDKLATKSDAVNCLLAELAKKTRQIESIVEIEDVLEEIDEHVSEHIVQSSSSERERITRLLIGSVEGQELRFPLFKNRLTIGRTDQNDIQLKANYVSRRHAVIVTDREATRLIDWGSKNGVFVNGTRVTEHFLNTGDIVTIGTADFRYEERPKRES